MLKSLESIQHELVFVLNRMSINDPRRDHLVNANNECIKIIDHFINDGK